MDDRALLAPGTGPEAGRVSERCHQESAPMIIRVR